MEEEEEGKQLNAQTLWRARLSRREEGETRRGDGTGCSAGGCVEGEEEEAWMGQPVG